MFERLAVTLALLLFAFASQSVNALALSTADRVLLAEYRALGRGEAPVLLATSPGQTRAVVAALGKLGARIIGRRDAIGYLYAFVPLDAMKSVLLLEGLEAVQIAGSAVRATMEPDAPPSGGAPDEPRGKVPRVEGAAPSAALGPDNPYTGEAATQALDFKSRFPTFDGRGVVTAFVEPIAPNLESMRGALDLSGNPLPKFARYELLKPASADEAVTASERILVWQHTERVEPRADGTFSWRSREYRLPGSIAHSEITSIRWRMCRRLASPFIDEYDILWAQDRERVWVLPASAGVDFDKARSVSPGAVSPWVPVHSSVGGEKGTMAKALVLAVDRKRGWLAVAPTWSIHGAMVGSVMAGSGFMGSKANGVAPAAQISIFLGSLALHAPRYDAHEQIFAMLSDPAVDVAQASVAVGDTSRFGAASIHRIWADRLIAASGKPFVKAAGNYGARLHGMSEFTMAESVFAVGAYTPRATWRANFGIEPASNHALPSFSAWGPARDGGLKPDFLALTHTLSEGGSARWYWDGHTQDYGASGGTSAAAPHGAGHVALLVSAAKQTGVKHDAFRLRAAIATTAQFLEGVEARAQGHGLIQVSDAWTALQRAQQWVPPSFEVLAPLVGQERGLDGPGRFTGRGLFEISGWKPRQAGRRELIVTRKGGAPGASRFILRWKGNTNAFRSSLQEVALPLGHAVSIPVDIRVGESGSYSAILDLIDPAAELVAGSILNTVMVADDLVPDGDGLRYERESPRPGSSVFYVDVPSGLSSVMVSIAKDTGKALWAATDPTGRLLPFNPYGSEVYRPSDQETFARREQNFAYPDPVPGVWQFEMRSAEPRSMADLEAVEDWSRPMPLKVHIQGRTGTENETAIAQASQSSDTGATREAEAVLRPGLEPVFFDVQIDPGTTSFDVQVRHAEPKARVGLYVFKLPEGERIATTLNSGSDHTSLVYYDSSLQSRKRYSLAAPPPGRYRVALDPIDVPGRQIKVSYAWREHLARN